MSKVVITTKNMRNMGEFIGKQSKINNALLQVLSSIRNAENSYAVREIEEYITEINKLDWDVES